MKKLTIVTFFLFFVLVFNKSAFALPIFQINPCVILGNCPTPTPTPTPLDCAVKGCDNTTNPCKASLTCIQANNGSNYCTLPEYTNACKANPSTDTCCSALPTVTPSPTPTITPTPKPEESISPSPSLSVSPTIMISISPTQQKPTESSNSMVKDIAIGLVIISLVSALIVSNLTKIKTWLHDKTK